MLRSRLYDYSDAYIFVGGTITTTRGSDDATEENKRMEKICNGVIFSNWVLFCEWTRKLNNIQTDYTKIQMLWYRGII